MSKSSPAKQCEIFTRGHKNENNPTLLKAKTALESAFEQITFLEARTDDLENQGRRKNLSHVEVRRLHQGSLMRRDQTIFIANKIYLETPHQCFLAVSSEI